MNLKKVKEVKGTRTGTTPKRVASPKPSGKREETIERPFDDVTDLARRAVEVALKAGAEEADAVIGQGRTTKVLVRYGEVEELIQAGSKAMGIRALVGGRTAVLKTSDFSRQGVERVAREVTELARVSGKDPFAGVPAPGRGALPRGLDLFDPAILADPMEAKVERARVCEAAAQEVSRKIENTQGTEFNESIQWATLVTSAGFEGSYGSTSATLYTVPIAVARGKRQTDYWFSSVRHLEDLEDPARIGRRAAERSLGRLGGRVPETGKFPVVFDPVAAGTIVGHFAAAVCGDAVYRDASFLRDRLGESVAGKGFDLVDDPLLVRGLGSRPFDDEGLKSKKTHIIRGGVLERFLTDSYAARKLKKPRTHSAARGVASVPGVATSNLYVPAGQKSPEAIIGSVDRGVYVTSFMGHGVNIVTGDYSRGATGFMIEKGKLTYPIQGFTIAGNLKDMLRGVKMIGSDLDRLGATFAPTLRIDGMTVAGS